MLGHSRDKKAGNRLVRLYGNMSKYNKAPAENSGRLNKNRHTSSVQKLDHINLTSWSKLTLGSFTLTVVVPQRIW